MDIWEWLKDESVRLSREGHVGLVRGLLRLPSLVCDDRHAEADALVPELLSGARELSLDWLEVYVRHWHLQSRVLHRMEGESALAEAVSLVELSHRDSHRGCPQTVCAVQDLTVCYAFTDGPGYAEERLAVTDETLARIDPTWACFGCISSEHGDAMIDQGRPAEALAFVERQVAARVLTGQADSLWSTAHLTRMDALAELGRFEELLAFLDGCEKAGRDDAHEVLRRRVMRARALVGLGRIDEAKAVFPAVAEVEPTPVFYLRWTSIARSLAEAGALANDAALGKHLRQFSARLLRQGVYRSTVHLAEHAGHLAAARGASHIARREAAMMRRAAEKLRKPLDAMDRIGRLDRAIAALPAPEPLPDNVDDALYKLAEGMEPEAALLWLERAHAAWPDDPRLVVELSAALDDQGLAGEAIAALRAAVARGTTSNVAAQLCALLTDAGEFDEAKRIAATLVESGAAVQGLAQKARIARAEGQYAEAAAHLDALLEAAPELTIPRQLRVDVARKMRDFPAMLTHVEALIERDPRPVFHWDRILAATITGAWDRVRASCAALGMSFGEGDGPIDRHGPLCRIRFEDRGQTRDLWARRSGPVTARIVQITGLDEPSRTQDVVAFDAAPINPPPATEADKEGHSWLYPYVATLSEGGYRTYAIDGVFPGEAEWQELRTALGDKGAPVQTQSGETYVLARPGSEDRTLRGLYAFVAVQQGESTAQIHELLAARAARFPEPLVWPDLAEAAGDTDVAARHRALAAEWKL